MLRFALKNMAIKKMQVILVVLSIVISAGIGVLAYNVATQVDDGITENAGYYSLIIGPQGSKTQLAMNTMYFSDSPVGTIPYSVVTDLMQDSRVNSVIPFAMADSYNGSNVVGTKAAFLDTKKLAEGNMFSDETTLEAVVGSNIAKYNNLKLGDVIYTSHSASDSDLHTQGIKVVGILEESHSSYDNIVFTHIRTLWQMHDHGHEEEEGEEHHEEEAQFHDPEEASVDEANENQSAEDPVHATEPSHDEQREEEHNEEDGHDEHEHINTVCAVLVNTKNPGFAMQMATEYNGKIITRGDNNYTLQAIEPMDVVRDVLKDADNTKYIVFVLCAVILIMNIVIISIITLLNMYHSSKEISLMRLIGIGMNKINLLYIIQNGIIGLVSTLLAFGVSRLCLYLMNDYVSSMGVVLNMGKVYPIEFIILAAVFVISVLPTVIWTFTMSRKDSISD